MFKWHHSEGSVLRNLVIIIVALAVLVFFLPERSETKNPLTPTSRVDPIVSQ